MKISAIYLSPGHNFFGHNGRPAGEHPTHSVDAVECVAGRGLRGDRFWDYRDDYAGQVTFFAEEEHAAILRELRPTARSSSVYRRNVITRGADLPSLIGQEFVLQGVRFRGIKEAKPCYWMDRAVAPGAEAALRGRGGLRAKILSNGVLRVDCPSAVGLLLAGGRSRRMGRDKAGLEWQGRTLGEHQAGTLSGTGAWPLYVACRAEQAWAPVGFGRIIDPTTDAGPLGGLIHAFAATNATVVATLAIDLPLIRSEWLEGITGQSRQDSVSVVPRHAGRFEPLAAAWHASALPELKAALSTGRSFQDVCATLAAAGQLRGVELVGDAVSQFVNINTPEDLAPFI